MPSPSSRRARSWALVPILLAACGGSAFGPNGGPLLTIDPGELRVEVALDRAANKVWLRFTGGDGRTPAQIEAGDVSDLVVVANAPDVRDVPLEAHEPSRGMVDAVHAPAAFAPGASGRLRFRYQGLLLQADVPAEAAR